MLIKTFIAAAALALACAAAFSATLENGCFRLAIDDAGRLTELYNKKTATQYCHGKGEMPVAVFAMDSPAPRPIPLVCDKTEETENGIVCEYSGGEAKVTLTVSEDKSRPEIVLWDAKVRNEGAQRITEIQCPRVSGLRIGSRAYDDTLVRPNRYGEKIPYPAKNLFRKPGETVNGNRYEGWWNSPRLEYAGQAGMFWMDLYGGGSGFYIASEDKTLTGGYLDANVNGGFLELGLGKYTDVKQNGSARYLFATGIHTGDWRRGADIYREWAYSFMREPKVPAWAREMPGWLWHSSIWSMGPDKPKMKAGFDFGNVKSDMFDRAVSLGTGVIGLAGLEFMGHDYPLWEPDLLLGGDKAIIEAVKNVHRRGGRIVPYINPIYAWENYPGVAHCDDLQYRLRLKALNKDVLQPDWEYYRQFAALRYDGTWNNVETHYHGNLPQMCLATKEWQDYVLWWTKRYAEYYGFDGVQWDQLGAYQNTYCLDESHGHSVSGCATEGISTLCKRIFSDPEYGVGDDFYIWYEGASDIYGQYLHAGHSGFDLWMAYGFPELIQYTFGKDLLGGEYNLMDGMQREGRVRAFRCVESSFLGRYKLGTGQNEEKALKLQKLTPLLNLLKGIYWYTEYKGRDACAAPEGVETSLLEVRRDICPYLDCGGYAVPVCDMRKNKTECEVSFEGDIPVTEALWFRAGANPRGVPVPFTAENGRITVTLPENGGQSAFDFRQAYCKDDKKVSSPGLLILTEKKTSPLLIELPLRAERGKSFTVRTLTETGREALEEGEVSAEKAAYGDLRPVKAYDSGAEACVKNGRACFRIADPTRPYLYFQVQKESLRSGQSYTFEVEFLDGEGAFDLQYNSTDIFAAPARFGEFFKDYKATDTQFLGETGKWKKARFTADDCSFSGAMNGGGDLRLRLWSGSLYVASVKLIKERRLTEPAPFVKVYMGNQEITTGENGEAEYAFAPEDPAGIYRVEAKTEKRNLLPAQSVIEVY